MSDENAKRLRRNSTEAETIMWAMLRDRRFGRWKFRRQHRVDFYILDFFCPRLKICVEVDGAPHFTSEGTTHDLNRDTRLAALDIRVLRFENREVVANPGIVMKEITAAINKRLKEWGWS